MPRPDDAQLTSQVPRLARRQRQHRRRSQRLLVPANSAATGLRSRAHGCGRAHAAADDRHPRRPGKAALIAMRDKSSPERLLRDAGTGSGGRPRRWPFSIG